MSAAVEAVSASREIASGGVRRVMWLTRGLAGLRQLAPYAAIELLLPGGSLIALVLWLYRRQLKAAQVPVGSGNDRHADDRQVRRYRWANR
jgi:hypothetical protein